MDRMRARGLAGGRLLEWESDFTPPQHRISGAAKRFLLIVFNPVWFSGRRDLRIADVIGTGGQGSPGITPPLGRFPPVIEWQRGYSRKAKAP